MKDWAIHGIKYLSEKSEESINVGQTPLKAKYNLTFVEKNTGLLSTTTDLDIKKKKRFNFLNSFKETYSRVYKKKEISIFTAVVNEINYPKIGKFINTITRKLKRKGIDRLGYVWVRDIGEVKFEKHYHILIATSRVTKKQFYDLFHLKKHNKYKIKFVQSPNGITKYLNDKELYAAKRQRAYHTSRKFIKPKKKAF